MTIKIPTGDDVGHILTCTLFISHPIRTFGLRAEFDGCNIMFVNNTMLQNYARNLTDLRSAVANLMGCGEEVIYGSSVGG